MTTFYWIGYWLSVIGMLAAPNITTAFLGALTCVAMLVGFAFSERRG